MDFQLNRKDFIDYLFPIFILFCFFLANWSVFPKLLFRWQGGDSSYCYLVVPLFLYLCWDKRYKPRHKKEQDGLRIRDKGLSEPLSESGFRFGEFSWNVWGLVPISLAVLLMIAGELGSVETLMYIGIWGCILGIACCFYGIRVKHLGFPFLILGFIVPLPPFINRVLTFQLKLIASTIATYMLRLSGVTVFQNGNIIDIGVTQLQVVDACSGLRYLMPLLLLALLVGYFFSQGWCRKGILILLVLPLSVLLNSLRIWLSGLLTVMGHPELVESFFHDFSGWVIFMIAGAILYAISLILKKIKVRSEDQGLKSKDYKEDKENAAVGCTRPVVLTAIVCLMFVSSGYALKKIPSAKNLPPRTSLKSFPMQIGEWQGKRSYIKKEILNQLWSDDYVQATFFHPSKLNAVHVLIPFYEWQGTRHTAHAPQSCLLGGGWTLTGSDDRMIITDLGEGLRVKTLRMAKDDAKILGAYFFFQRGRVIISPWLNKVYLLWDAFSKRRTDGALVRAEMTLAPGQTYEDAYPVLEDFLVKLWPLLSEYVPN